MKHLKAMIPAALAMAFATTPGHAVEPPELIQLARQAPTPPWPAGDELGMANTLGEATNRRCAWHMAQPGARWYEASHPRSNTMPKSPFASGAGVKAKPTAGVPGSRHAFNSEAFEAGAEPGQQGTQIDALGHFAVKGASWDPAKPFSADDASYYGGYKQAEVKPSADSLLQRLSIDKIPPLVSTAVVLDAKAHVGGGERMKDGQLVTAEHIKAMLAAQGLGERGLLPGDMVWIYTGWSDQWQDPATDTPYYAMAPGLSVDAADYLGEQAVLAVGVDTPFIDPVPGGMLQGKAPPAEGTPPGLPFAIHHHMLTEAGVYHLENMKLGEMARDKVWLSCAMVLPTLDKGAAGAPVRPVAVGRPAG
ncbi:MAG: cyclase family protein [Burkholderiaceae bacterium]